MNTPIWRISQTHLNTFATCPRKFQYIYLEQLMSPCTGEQPQFNLGNRFHRFMQQRELGLSTDAILATDEPLRKSFEALAQAAPNIINPQPQTWRKAEHLRTYLKGNILLTGIYDLLILSPTKATIIDWKTYPQPPNTKQLANHWQTRLYLYLLAETSNYSPEDIELTYWFINPKRTTSLTFVYSKGKHDATERQLTELLNQLSAYWEDYQQNNQPFPQIEESQGYCQSCPFMIPCNRHPKSYKENISLDEIEEIVI